MIADAAMYQSERQHEDRSSAVAVGKKAECQRADEKPCEKCGYEPGLTMKIEEAPCLGLRIWARRSPGATEAVRNMS